MSGDVSVRKFSVWGVSVGGRGSKCLGGISVGGGGKSQG